MIERCVPCQELLPRQQALPLTQTSARAPLAQTSADLFSLSGKTYLAFADRFSGMVWADRLLSSSTSAVTKLLEKWFYDVGFPKVIRTDGGPQFRGPFKEWCSSQNIIHEVSSPYHPALNGHAEAAVKTAKYLLEKLDSNLALFKEHLFAWRNMPRPDGFSPSDLFFGRRLSNPCLPTVRPDSCHLDSATSSREKARARTKDDFDDSARLLQPLSPGDAVLYSTPQAAWGGRGTVTSVRPDQLSYHIRPTDGSADTVRNRRHLRPVKDNE